MYSAFVEYSVLYWVLGVLSNLVPGEMLVLCIIYPGASTPEYIQYLVLFLLILLVPGATLKLPGVK